jgi:hypothetical protein
MAREENVWNLQCAKIGGFGVLRVFDIVTIGKTFYLGGSFAAEHTRNISVIDRVDKGLFALDVNVTDGAVDLDGDGLAEVSFHLRVALF